MTLMALCDIIVAGVSGYMAMFMRFEGQELVNFDYSLITNALPVYFIVTIAVMLISGLYNRVWSYASARELMEIAKASVIIEVIIILYHVFFVAPMPRIYFLLQFIVLVTGFSVIRFSKVAYKHIYKSLKSEEINRHIMIVGAGSAASIIIREIEKYGTHAKAVCAIDDNINKKNKAICGIPIVGTREDIPAMAEKYKINEIIIAMPSAGAEDLKNIIKVCQDTEIPVKILPSIAKSLKTSLINEVRNVNYEDLLGRDPIVVNHEGITDFMSEKVVMVTGGGGSIGSELCRQIIRYNPKQLIIFDIYENNAYSIQMELERKYPEKDIVTLIGSVRDYDRMEMVFREYHPDIIYHAAAHKHVPLMEKSPNEAIKNNCLGTYNLAKLADLYKVQNFVLISTDKAVRPTNIMGATKRICEMIIQMFSKKSVYTRYAAVRFGNVLGSNGSVIPLFLKQIENGGPVTVTHKDITRFFMTIPEAVSLVLQAGLFAKGGEIFVLDMGDPVKIYDLAKNLIRMKGFVPDKDIEIRIVGLRPGEKLYEELLMEEENLKKTDNQLIFIGQPIKFDEEKFQSDLNDLIKAASDNAPDIKELTTKVCDTYRITDN